jgi:Fe2+ or Zn2+ uptake regulation protein
VSSYAAEAGRRRDTPVPGDVRSLLHSIGLCSTRQRIALVSLLLGNPKRQVTADILYDEIRQARRAVSRPTVYNALRQFERAGLLRRTAVRRSKKTWFVIADANGDEPRRTRAGIRALRP